jgi:predicted Rossmann-fold nucleotide-binding protein
MAAMNQGASDGNGKIVGVIHEMFVVDGSDWLEGSHSVFAQGGKHEILVARGDNLQERKRLLVEGADALVVLPGGPGTWDEVRGLLNISVGIHTCKLLNFASFLSFFL